MKHRSWLAALVLAVTATLSAAACGGGGGGEDKAAPVQATGSTVTGLASLNGTYRYVLTEADADAAGDTEKQDFPVATTITLKDGRLEGRGCFGGEGVNYSTNHDLITFHDRESGDNLTVTFTVDDQGSLHLTPVPPMHPGVAFQCFYKPWTKID